MPCVPWNLSYGREEEFSGSEYSSHPGFPVTLWNSDNTNSRDPGSRGTLSVVIPSDP